MQFTLTSISAILALLPLVSAHGVIISPARRHPGAAFGAACGNTVRSLATSDPYGPTQLWQQNIPSPPPGACDLQICKGLKFADQSSSSVQVWTKGQVVPIQVEIRAKHTGWAKVEIIDSASGTPIGTPLKEWAVYASNALPDQPGDTNFSVTIPDLAGVCATAGDCALQWYWHSPSPGNDQTYISCIDFTQAP